MKTALLLGSYGQTNLGDDILMYNYLKYLTDKGYEKIYVNVSKKEYVPIEVLEAFSNIIHTFETYNTTKLNLFRIANSCDAIFYGGGTIYKELYSSTGRGKYSVIFNIALFNIVFGWLLHKRIYNLNIGTGILKTKFGKLLAWLSVRPTTLTLVRDLKSYEVMTKSLKLKKEQVIQSTDGIFINQDWRNIPPQKAEGRSDTPSIAVNLVSEVPDNVDRKSYVSNAILFIQNLLSLGYTITLLPFQSDFNDNNDYIFLKDEILPHLNGSVSIIKSVKLSELQNTFYQHDYVVATRFHCQLLSIINNSRFLAINYDTKCERLMKELNYPYSININNITSQNMLSLFRSLTKNINNDQSKNIRNYVIANNTVINKTLINNEKIS